MKSSVELRFFYPLIVWAITVVSGPLIWLVYQFYVSGFFEGIGMIEILLPMIFIGAVMSLPTLLAIIVGYIVTTRYSRVPMLVKLITLLITMLGIWFSLLNLGGSLKIQFASSYSVAALIAILIITPKKKD